MKMQFRKTTALALVLGVAGLAVAGPLLASGPGDAEYNRVWEQPRLPSEVAQTQENGVWTDLGGGTAPAEITYETLQPNYGNIPAQTETYATGADTQSYVGPVTTAPAAPVEQAPAPVAEATPPGDDSATGGYAPGQYEYGGFAQPFSPYPYSPYSSATTSGDVGAISGYGSYPAPLHDFSGLHNYTSPFYDSYGSGYGGCQKQHHGCAKPAPVYTQPQVVHAPPRIEYRDRVVEKKVFVDRPVYVPRPVPVDRKVFVDRPVYVDRKVVVNRPIYVPRPVPVDRPVYVERRVAVPVPKPVPVHIDRPVYVPKPVPVHVDRPVYVPKPVPVHILKPVPVDRPVYVERRVPVPVPRPFPVDRPVYVPKPVPVHVERHIPVPVAQPQVHGCASDPCGGHGWGHGGGWAGQGGWAGHGGGWAGHGGGWGGAPVLGGGHHGGWGGIQPGSWRHQGPRFDPRVQGYASRISDLSGLIAEGKNAGWLSEKAESSLRKKITEASNALDKARGKDGSLNEEHGRKVAASLRELEGELSAATFRGPAFGGGHGFGWPQGAPAVVGGFGAPVAASTFDFGQGYGAPGFGYPAAGCCGAPGFATY